MQMICNVSANYRCLTLLLPGWRRKVRAGGGFWAWQRFTSKSSIFRFCC